LGRASFTALRSIFPRRSLSSAIAALMSTLATALSS